MHPQPGQQVPWSWSGGAGCWPAALRRGMSISNVRPRLALRDLPPADAAERKTDEDVMRHVFYIAPVPGGAQVGTDGTTWAVSLATLAPRLADLSL